LIFALNKPPHSNSQKRQIVSRLKISASGVTCAEHGLGQGSEHASFFRPTTKITDERHRLTSELQAETRAAHSVHPLVSYFFCVDSTRRQVERVKKKVRVNCD
jgi:hypothetical protein